MSVWNEFQRIAVKHQQEEQLAAYDYLPQNNTLDQTTAILSDTADRYLFPQSSQYAKSTTKREGFFQRFCSGIKYIFTGQSEPTPQAVPAQTNNNNMVYGKSNNYNLGANGNLDWSSGHYTNGHSWKGYGLFFQ